MKRKNQFILIGVIAIIIFIFLIYKLLNLQSPVSEKHIGIKFEIHNCTSVEKNSAELRENFLKPLLEFNTVQSKTESTENLYLPSVKCIDKTFCIPAIGINAIRYNSKTETLQESTMTSTSREGDQEAFFSNWNGGDNLSLLEKNLLKNNPKAQQNPSLYEIKKIDKLDVIFIDSFIIDKNCSDQVIENNKPYIFRSTADLRNYINNELEKNPNALEKGTVNKTIHIYIYCGAGEYLLNKNDRDNDGVNNEFDACPDFPGEKANKGCPVKEDIDGDGVYDEDDSCPTEKGDKACDGCPCPPPIVKPDYDKDGIQNSEDACPKEFGFRRYKGCPIPDTDGDGVNDEIDKCPAIPGPASNKGCPLDIKISHNNKIGKFMFPSSISNFNDYKVIMEIKQSNGKIVNQAFSGYICPTNDEAKKIIKSLSDPVDLVITVVIKDKSGKEINRSIFYNLSMICFADTTCGFVDLDRN